MNISGLNHVSNINQNNTNYIFNGGNVAITSQGIANFTADDLRPPKKKQLLGNIKNTLFKKDKLDLRMPPESSISNRGPPRT
jgi:hypothetical protein